MTPILFLLVYATGVILTIFRHPIFGLYTYLLTFYLSPSHSWWANEVPELRYQFIIAAVTLLVTINKGLNKNRTSWLTFRPTQFLLIFALWMWIQYFWAIDPDLQLEGAIILTKHILIYYLIYMLADTHKKMLGVLLGYILGCAWFGYLALEASSGRLETIGGPVGGSNELGLHVTGALLVGGIYFMFLRDRFRIIILLCLPLVVNTLVLTVSRGAFLGLIVGGSFCGCFIPKGFRVKFLQLAVLGMILISLLAHDALIERFTTTWIALTTEEVELDNSASSRAVIFDAGMRIGQDYPLGVGYRGTAKLSTQYMPEWVLSSDGHRSAHNTFAAVFAEHGYPGAAMYILIILWVLLTLVRTSSFNQSTIRPMDHALLVALLSSLVALYVSGLFSNYLFTDSQYWLLALTCALLSRIGVKESEQS